MNLVNLFGSRIEGHNMSMITCSCIWFENIFCPNVYLSVFSKLSAQAGRLCSKRDQGHAGGIVAACCSSANYGC